MRTIEYEIEQEHGGKTVETYLRKEKMVSLKLIRHLKQTPKGLLLNGNHVRSIDLIKKGDVLQINLPEAPKEVLLSNAQVEILFEDTDIIVYNKPSGMPCHQSKWHQDDTLANVFAAKFKDTPITYRPINRLDMDTTGAIVIAKNTYVASALSGNVDKRYIAICCGNISNANGVIEANIGQEEVERMKRKVDPQGQYAKTEYTVLNKKNNYTLIRVKIYTGRTHQIRVHMAHIGFPLAGDRLYGGGTQHIKRQALHCEQVMFLHPITKQHITVVANMPIDMKNNENWHDNL